MTLATQNSIIAGLLHLQASAHSTSRKHGYWEKDRNPGEVTAPVHTDTSDAARAIYRPDRESVNLAGYSNLEESLADAVIRAFDFAGGYELRLASAIVEKLKHNKNQIQNPARHVTNASDSDAQETRSPVEK